MGRCRVLLLLLAVGVCFVISQASACIDKEKKECPGWKKNGFCKQSSQWYGYMKDNCKKTCGYCPSAASVATAECKDNRKECSFWASTNECKKNPVYMNKNCRKSCGICKSHFSAAHECKDNNNECSFWASTNECKKNPIFMNKNCRKSCGICKSAVTVAEECKDKNKECSSWASKDECKKNAVWMAKNCRKSCGICGCKDKFDTKKCQGWANKGECKKNLKWMNENCQRSCKACKGSTSTSTKKKEEKKTVNTGATKINDVYCGLRLKLRVVGGEDAEVGDWPWQIAIAKKRTPKTMFCGGSLINKQWVVTASHCFGSANSNRIKPSDIVIRIGDHNLKKDEGFETVSNVTKIIRNKGYEGYGRYDNDITLIKLEKPIEYNQNIKPVCLPAPKAEEKPEQMCFVTGWGRLAEFGKVAEILQEAKIPIVKRETCKAAMGLISDITSNMICAGYKKGGIDACQGDSGGPLVCNNGGRFELVGVVSWGKGCAEVNHYGVYTKVSNYIDWIKKNIKE